MASNSRNGPVELVTASALDAEWKKFELEAMTKKGRKKRGGHRRGNLNARWRDQWCLSRAEALRHRFIRMYRPPLHRIWANSHLAYQTRPRPIIRNHSCIRNQLQRKEPASHWHCAPDFVLSRSPTNLTFPARLDLRTDTESNRIPLRI